MSASVSNAQNPPIAASQNATAANPPIAGSSANVAAGTAQPTARSSYANATKKISSPPIASSGPPPVAVGGPQTAQHGKSSSVSPVNGSNTIKPAVPAMGPTIVNSSTSNGAPSQGDHSRKSSVTITAAGASGFPNGGPVSSRAPSNLTFGSLANSPAPSHASPHHSQGANLNPQAQNPRVASPAHSPSPIPTPISGGGKPDSLPTRPNLVFGGQSSDSAESNARPISMPPQPNSHPQAQHLRRESSQSAHSDMSNANMNRGFPPNAGRGRGFNPNYNPQMGHHSPQPGYRPLPNQSRGAPQPFQPQGPMHGHPNSPYRPNRSPAITPATMHQQAHLANPGMPYYPGQPYPQQPMYGMPPQGLDPYNQYYGQNYGLQQSMHYPGVPASPGRGHGFPQQMQNPYPMPASYGQPPQAQGMSRTPSNMSERPPSAVAAPSTPAMTNVNHVSHNHTPSVTSSSPAPSSSTFNIPKKSKAIVIKNADGEVVDFNKKPSSSPAPAPAPPRSPAIAATPTPPPRAPSATDSTKGSVEGAPNKSKEETKADFVKQFHEKLRMDQEKEEAEKKAKDAEAKAQKEAEESAAREKEEADKAAKEKEAAEKAAADEADKKKKEEEEFERMVAEMEAQEKEEEEKERKFQEEKRKKVEAEKAKESERIKAEEEKLRAAERDAEAAEAARAQETPEQKAEREALFASLKKNTQFGPGANQTESGASTPSVEPSLPTPPPPKPTSATKPKPAALKLETNKPVEPAQPTAGMQSLKSARFLQVRSELVNYPEGIKSPNPALNLGIKNKGRQYDKEFLLQFQDVFKEKPSTDWDMKLKETVGDSTDSARPQSARPSSMMSRQQSRPGLGPSNAMGNFQGSFGSGLTLPPGTTSEQRFREASKRGSGMVNPLAQIVQGGNRPGSFSMGPPQMIRTGSFQNMSQAGPNSPRIGSSRGRGSRRGDNKSKKEEEQQAKSMPLTAGQEVKALERSTSGWKGFGGIAQPQQAAGHMAPDLVQRKVKAALNKMTPEKFDKISDQILEIAAQSKDESDGRTLRQVIQLTFEKACDEQHWSSMYAKFCSRMLATMSTDIKDENVKDKHGNPVVGGALFRKYLLNRCQEEFERGWEVNLPEMPSGGEAKLLSEEYYVAAAAKRRGLGLIQFIGELYKLGMLTLRIMHECVLKLLDFEGLPDESAIESLVKLLRTVGATMENTDTGPKMIAVYFERVEKIMNMETLPSRLKFMLMDVVDLRKAGWKSKDDAKGPKTIQEIHQEVLAAQQAQEMERTRSNQRGPRPAIGRGDARSFSGGGMMPPQDSGRVQMDDLRKLSKGVTQRNLGGPSAFGPSMLGSRSNSGRRGLGPGGLMGNRGDESGASSRTATPPVQKEKESTAHANAFSALAALDNDNAGEVGSPPSTASSPPQGKSIPAKSAAVEAKEAKPSE